MVVDATAALRSYLLEHELVDYYTQGRVYVGTVPQSELPSMPEQCVVIVPAGGAERNRTLRVMEPRVDLFCYGRSHYEAGEVDRSVYTALRAIQRTTVAGVVLHSAGVGGGPRQLTDPQTGWPFVLRTAVVTVAEYEAE